MSRQFIIPGWLDARALIVVAALVCLCVSSNVGLEFFPLPAASTQVTLSVQTDEANKTSQAPITEAEGFRVPMMAQSKKRADEKTPQSQSVLLLSTVGCCTQGDIRSAIENNYSPRLSSLPTLAPAAGRAPPPSSV